VRIYAQASREAPANSASRFARPVFRDSRPGKPGDIDAAFAQQPKTPRIQHEPHIDAGRMPARGTVPNMAWDFTNVPVLSSDQTYEPETKPLFTARPLPIKLHPKLAIGRANDPLEHEADRVADQVVRMPDLGPSISAAPLEPKEGRKPIAHELARMVQQVPGGVRSAMRQPATGSVPSAESLSLFPQIPGALQASCSATSGDPFERQPAELQDTLRRSFGDAKTWFRELAGKRATLTSIYNRLCQFGLWDYVDTIRYVESGEKPFLDVFEVAGNAGNIGFTTTSDTAPALKGALLNTFRFCADSPLGGSQHKDQASFREVSRSDSLHVAVGPGINFDAHIDRISPALAGAGNVCVYDPASAAAHIGRELIPQKIRSWLGIPGFQIFPEPPPTLRQPEREAPPALIGIELRFPGL
jgi:hypothetical protein